MYKRSFGSPGGMRPEAPHAASLIHDGHRVPESLVTAQEAANFLAVTKRRILELARQGQIPAHPIGNGQRKTWRFRLSEIIDRLESKRKGTNSTDSEFI